MGSCCYFRYINWALNIWVDSLNHVSFLHLSEVYLCPLVSRLTNPGYIIAILNIQGMQTNIPLFPMVHFFNDIFLDFPLLVFLGRSIWKLRRGVRWSTLNSLCYLRLMQCLNMKNWALVLHDIFIIRILVRLLLWEFFYRLRLLLLQYLILLWIAETKKWWHWFVIHSVLLFYHICWSIFGTWFSNLSFLAWRILSKTVFGLFPCPSYLKTLNLFSHCLIKLLVIFIWLYILHRTLVPMQLLNVVKLYLLGLTDSIVWELPWMDSFRLFSLLEMWGSCSWE